MSRQCQGVASTFLGGPEHLKRSWILNPAHTQLDIAPTLRGVLDLNWQGSLMAPRVNSLILGANPITSNASKAVRFGAGGGAVWPAPTADTNVLLEVPQVGL